MEKAFEVGIFLQWFSKTQVNTVAKNTHILYNEIFQT